MTTLSRAFTLADQVAFSEISGDNNLLHIDPIGARRSFFGCPIVHGMHSLMWALDQWMADYQKPVNLCFISAAFLKPIGLEKTIRLNARPTASQRIEMSLIIEETVAAKISFEWKDAASPFPTNIHPEFPPLSSPEAVAKEAVASKTGSLSLHLPPEAVRRQFPQLAKFLCPTQIATLLAASRLVGVKCPGLNSIFSELTLSAVKNNVPAEMKYSVTDFDDRYGLVLMAVDVPNMTGTIKAFVRPSAQAQPNFSELKKLVMIGEFSGERALVIGGSRGLGEVTAKLLAAGGANVQLTYHLGQTDALKVVEDIVAGGGTASALAFNVTEPKSRLPKLEPPTHLYYFATPFIAASPQKQFSPELFQTFCEFFVTGFAKTFEHIKGASLKNVFYPSTIFIEELPAGLIEYAAAKMAGEIFCQSLKKKYSEMRIAKPRLPKMATDQTVSLLPVQNPDPAPLMLKALRDFHQ